MSNQIEVESKNQRFAVVDIETSGGDPRREKITEIAIFLLEDGEIIDEFSTLINPEKHIPSYITNLTGITDQMVEGAPKFYEVAKRIVEITQDAVFVGHNVGFDYGFVRNEFKRLGYKYRRVTFDTVRMSRKVLPGHASYSLGNLCADLGIVLEDRHRAGGDARATVDLLRLILDTAVDDDITMTYSIKKKFGKNIAHALFEDLPEETGVFYLHDSEGNVLYVGKSTNVAKRATTIFSNCQDEKVMDMCLRVADISYEVTSSDLIATLKEDIEIVKCRPPYNKQPRRRSNGYGIYAYYNSEGYFVLSVERKVKDGVLVASFPSVQRAKRSLNDLIAKFGLCQKICGLYKSEGACFHYQIGSCKGACRGEELPDTYNQRVEQAIEHVNETSRNFYVVEVDKATGEASFVKVEKGKLVGFGSGTNELLSGNISEIDDLITPCHGTDSSIRIIHSFIAKSKNAKVLHF